MMPAACFPWVASVWCDFIQWFLFRGIHSCSQVPFLCGLWKLRVSFLWTPVGELPIAGVELGLSSFGNAIRAWKHAGGSEEGPVCRRMEAELKAWLIMQEQEQKGDTWELRTWVKQVELLIWCHLVISRWGLWPWTRSAITLCAGSLPLLLTFFEKRSKLEV